MEKNRSPKHTARLVIVLLVTSLSQVAVAQRTVKSNRLEGEVSYTTSENIYLRFETTEPLVLGDTVYRENGEIRTPCLIIQQKSSVSSIATPLAGCTLTKGDKVVYFYANARKETQADTVGTPVVPIDSAALPTDTLPKAKAKENEQAVYGRVSVANYTTLNGQDVNNRAMARLSLNADHIAGSNLSFRTYLNYRQNTVTRADATWNDSRFNVFEMALSQAFSPTFHVTAGRFINRKMASMGAIDGITIDKSWRSVYAGVIAGFRPDPVTYGFSSNLLQFGGYMGVYHNAQKSAYTNLGVINQSNGGAVDRRYLFLQHQSTLAKKVYLFASSEVDIYTIDTAGVTSASPRITSLYLSLTYRLSTKLSLSASYDVRQNVILYQSYEDRLQNLLDYDPMRTGLRFGATYTFSTRFRTGMNVSLRSQSDNSNAYLGALFYASVSKLPANANLYLALSVNKNTSFQYQSAYLRYMQPMFSNKVTLTPYYRFVRHSFTQVEVAAALQHYAGVDCSFRLTKLLSLGALYEYNLQRDWAYNRFNINLIQRF